MKTSSKYIALAAIAFGLAACTQEEEFAPQQSDIVQIATANIATEVQTRVNTLADGTIFENTDKILLVNNSRTTNKNSGTYTYDGTSWKLSEGVVLYASTGTNDFNAYYPASVDFTLPADQSTEAGIKSADRMVATTNGVAKGDAVELNFERQNAKVTITPTIASQYTGGTICEFMIGGVKPYTSDNVYTAILEPTESGFTVSLKVGSDELTATSTQKLLAGKHYTFNLTVGKAAVTLDGVNVDNWNSATLEGGVAEEIPYLTFKAASEQTLDLVQTESQMLNEWGYPLYKDDEETIPVLGPNPYPGFGDDDGSIQYSKGNSNEWKIFTKDTDPVEFGGDMGDLRLRGKSLKGTLQAQIVFGDTTSVACSGDIRTLVDWENYENAVTDSAIFQGLFKGCSVLTSAPELPATTLAPYCYYSMFDSCTSLKDAPALPATTLAPYCYKSMFYDCTSLKVAPVLPATDLAENCYGQMFDECTSLNAAPELPATTLADDCYNGMFAGCTSLNAAPELPATTLAGGCYLAMFARCSNLTSAPELPVKALAYKCYSNMFDSCSKLESAPVLPADTLAESCYYEMFKGCTSLNSVTMLATDISVTNCLTDWLKDVADTGTFTKAAGMTAIPPNSESGIPEGWTVKDVSSAGLNNFGFGGDLTPSSSN